MVPPLLLLLGVTRVQMMTPSGSGSKLPTPWRKAAGSRGGRSVEGRAAAAAEASGKRPSWGSGPLLAQRLALLCCCEQGVETGSWAASTWTFSVHARLGHHRALHLKPDLMEERTDD